LLFFIRASGRWRRIGVESMLPGIALGAGCVRARPIAMPLSRALQAIRLQVYEK